MNTPRPETGHALIEPSAVAVFHAHVYFTPAQRPHARWLRRELARRYRVRLGRWRETPVGPHPRPMYQVAFGSDAAGQVMTFLMLNRGELDILVHPETGHGHAGDHAVRSAWLGTPQALDIGLLEALDRGRTHPA